MLDDAYLIKMYIVASAINVRVIGQQDAQLNTCGLSDAETGIVGDDLVDRQAVLASNTKAKWL